MILYYTGTGNSRYAAKLLGHRLNDAVRDCTPFIQGGTTPRFHLFAPPMPGRSPIFLRIF